jgi:hypothetical protein
MTRIGVFLLRERINVPLATLVAPNQNLAKLVCKQSFAYYPKEQEWGIAVIDELGPVHQIMRTYS